MDDVPFGMEYFSALTLAPLLPVTQQSHPLLDLSSKRAVKFSTEVNLPPVRLKYNNCFLPVSSRHAAQFLTRPRHPPLRGAPELVEVSDGHQHW